jgi:hypothetical protein
MVQVNGMREPVQRFSRERTGRVRYSTSWPRRMDSPLAARRAMPTRLAEESGKREGVVIFAICSPIIDNGMD